jgi:hypothetical protein
MPEKKSLVCFRIVNATGPALKPVIGHTDCGIHIHLYSA